MEKQRRVKMLSLSAVIVAVLGLTVAFAALSTTLNVKGSAYLDAAKWGIKFQNLSEPSIVGEASDAKTAKIEKDVSIKDIKVTLSKPGDSVTYTVDLVNDGDINAKIENIEKTALTEEQQKYITFTVKYKTDETELKIGDILSSGEVKPLVIKIEYRKDLESSDLPKSAQEINLSYKLDFVQTDAKVDTTSEISKACTTFEKKSTYSVGDVIALCNNDTKVSEDFYVISDNGSTVTALAKYNLFVGNTVVKNDDFSENLSSNPISKSEEGYGLQSSKTVMSFTDEGMPSSNNFVGVIAFSDQKKEMKGYEGVYVGYWTDSDENLSSKYGSSYPADVFDSNSNLYAPLKNYENYIKNTLKKTSASIDLISYSQFINLGCTYSGNGSGSCTLAPNFVRSTLYWSKSADGSNQIYAVAGDFSVSYFLEDGLLGVRPIITINKSEL